MKITKENIEEIIFDFYEGNLDDAGKAGLMDFLHKHPQYEKEFVLWAKTYHSDKMLLDYGHNDRFLKKTYAGVYKWLGFTSTICLIAGVWIWWPEKQVRRSEQEKVVQLSISPSANLNPTIEASKSNVVPVQKSAASKAEVVIEKQLSMEASVPDTIALLQNEYLSVQPDTIPIPAMEPEQKPAIVPALKAPEPPASSKKKQKKRKFDLTPTNDIVPFNSDF